MGFSTFDSARAAFKPGGSNLYVPYTKVAMTTAANRGCTLWMLGGTPAAGVVPTVGMDGAVKLSKADSYNFQNAASTWWIGSVTIARNQNLVSNDGCYLTVDRLAHANVLVSQATASFSPIIDGTDRLATGEGGMIIAEVTTVLSAAANVFTLTYTNENGVSHTTPQITTVASTNPNSFAYSGSYFYIPLADGDRGCRTITGFNLISGTATGAMNIAIVKPLVWANHPVISDACVTDYLITKTGLVPVHNNACLCMLGISTNSGGSFAFYNSITLIQG